MLPIFIVLFHNNCNVSALHVKCGIENFSPNTDQLRMDIILAVLHVWYLRKMGYIDVFFEDRDK